MPHEDYCTITLTKGQVAIVDAADFPLLSRRKWCAMWYPKRQVFYAAQRQKVGDGQYAMVGMHRYLMGLKFGDPRDVDHENLNTLDNRRSNLRIASRSENNMNTGLGGSYNSVTKAYKR